MRRTRIVPGLTAILVFSVIGLSACGGGSDDHPMTDLAAFAPADSAVYLQASVHPDSEVQANADEIAKKLTGKTLGEQLQGGISSTGSGVDYKTDVEPWIGDNVAVVLGEQVFAGEGGDADGGYTAIFETKDKDAASSFIEKQSKGGSSGEYDGVDYQAMKGDGAIAGIVDDHLVAAADVAGFKAVVDAHSGDSLKGAKGFSEVADKVSDDSLLNVYVGNPATVGGAGGDDVSGLYEALGMDPEKAGGVFSLIPEENAIAIRGYSADEPDLDYAGATDLIASFPADTVFALGTGKIGENATKTIEALDKEGAPGVLKPGQLGKMLDQISEQGLDLRSLIENLNDVGLFVQGDAPQTLGGALVLTSSDLGSVKSSFQAITGMIGMFGDGGVKLLGGGMTGISVRTPDLPGRPVVFAVGTDRIVIAVGMEAAKQALKADRPDLGSDEAFTAAKDSIGGDLAMYGDPVALGELLASGPDFEAAQFGQILGKFRYLAVGSGGEDSSIEINLGLK